MQEQQLLLQLSDPICNRLAKSTPKKQPQHPPPLQQCDKNDEYDDHIHATPSTQNAAIDDSVILQQSIRKKCIGCIDAEKKLYEFQHQIRSERRKNLRYLKIINTKVDKEKELQKAYREIAQELKKRMDAAQSIENTKQQLSQIYEKKVELLAKMEEKVIQLEKSLKETSKKLNESQQRYEDLLKLKNKKQNNQLQANLPTQQRILNIFYQQQIVELHQKINQLESQMKLQEEDFLSSQKLMIVNQVDDQRISCLSDDPIKSSHSVHEMMPNNERTSNRSKSHSQSKQMQQIQHPHHMKESNEIDGMKSFNMSKISSIEAKNDNSELDNIMEQFQREHSHTVAEWASDSFHTISNRTLERNSDYLSYLNNKYSEQEKQLVSLLNGSQSLFHTIKSESLQEDISNMSNRNSGSVSQDQFRSKQCQPHSIQLSEKHENHSNKSLKGIHQQNHELKLIEDLQIERKSYIMLADNIRHLLEHLGAIMNSQGQKFKLIIKIPQIPLFSQVTHHNINPIQNFTLTSTIIEEAAAAYEKQFQTILKLTRRFYEKQLNDQQLYLSQLKSRLNYEDDKKKQIERIVEKLQEHNTRLQYKISQASEESPIPSNKSVTETYLRSVIKKKASFMCQSKYKDEYAQCQILASNMEELRTAQIQNYAKVVQALTFLPKFLNEILKKSNIDSCLSIDFQKDLEPQIEDIIKRSFNHLHIRIAGYPQSHDANKKLRRSSFSSKFIPQADDKNKTKTYFLLQMENKRLQNNLKEKSQKNMALSQKITLQNIEKAQFEKQLQKLQQQIQFLKMSMADSSSRVSPIKFQHKESSQKIENRPTVRDNSSQDGQFVDYEEKIEFNNLFWDKDQQLKILKQKIEIYEKQLKKYQIQTRKRNKKIVYINH